jgi:hypothetical protein
MRLVTFLHILFKDILPCLLCMFYVIYTTILIGKVNQASADLASQLNHANESMVTYQGLANKIVNACSALFP